MKKNTIETWEITAVGVKPLLMNNPQMASATNHYKREINKYTSKRKKTDEDLEIIEKLSFMASCYWDEQIGLYIPTENIEACIRDGAKASRNGKKIAIAVKVEGLRIPLIERSGAKSLEELYQNEEFIDARLVNVMRAKVVRIRARFDQWKIVFRVKLDTAEMDRSDFFEALNTGAQKCGLGDYRPKYGVFEITAKQID